MTPMTFVTIKSNVNLDVTVKGDVLHSVRPIKVRRCVIVFKRPLMATIKVFAYKPCFPVAW